MDVLSDKAEQIPPAEAGTDQRAERRDALEGLLVLDAAGHIVGSSPQVVELWSLPEGLTINGNRLRVLRQALRKIVDRKPLLQTVRMLHRNPHLPIGDLRLRMKDGRILALSSLALSQGDAARVWFFRDVTESVRDERLREALFRITEVTRSSTDLGALFRSLHQIVDELMDATNFYIALYDDQRGIVRFPYFVDEMDELPIGTESPAGLTGYVLRTGEALLASPEVFDELLHRGEIHDLGAPSVDWLGVPLKSGDRTFGVLGVQSYDAAVRYDEQDKQILTYVSQHVAAVIEQKQREDELRESETRYRQMFENNRAVKLVIDPTNGQIVDANPAACEYYGYSLERLRSLRIWDINILPAEVLMDRMRLATRQKQNYFNFQHRLASGEIRDVEVHSGPFEVRGRHLLYSIITDTTEKRRAESMLRTQAAAIETSMDGIAVLTSEGAFAYMNDSFARLYGYADMDELKEHRWPVLHAPEESRIYVKTILPALHKEGHWRGETTGRRKSGRLFPQEMSLTQLEDGGLVCVVRDITERSQAEEQIRFLAYHDALTGLPNRLLFQDRLMVALSHARRDESKLAILFLDLDRFKVINDSLGHNVGDFLLQEVARRIQKALRQSDTVARLGGDEFTALLPALRHADDAASIAAKILEEIRLPLMIDERELFVTASVGISLFPEDGDGVEELIKNADTAMYQAKENGRDNVQLFNARINARAVERLALENGLRKAIANQEFVLHYQPISDLRSGRIHGVEALIRWKHPRAGLVLPNDFIPVAEATGLMIPIGSWVLRTACQQAVEWHRQGFSALSIAVNISVTQLQQPDFVDRVRDTLLDTNLPPQYLELEITEGSAMQNPESSLETLEALKALGCRISLDDFGIGYSSLSYLKRFPIDNLKIDQSFVRDMIEDIDTAEIVSAIIAMGHKLRMAVVAEGVEREAQRVFLNENRCDHMQGFLFRGPVAQDDFLTLLLDHNSRVGQWSLR